MDRTMKYVFLVFVVCAFSCQSIDIEKKAAASASGEAGTYIAPVDEAETVVAVPVETEPVIVEKPVYVPEEKAPAAPARGRAAVEASNRDGILHPQDYANAVMLYDYHKDFVYQVYCQPLRVTDITLEPGERVVEPPFISDSERWMVGAGVSYENEIPIQHIYVKPTAAALGASLIINSNFRVYHLILKSFKDIHMPVVRFRYPHNTMTQNYIRAGNVVMSADGSEDESYYADPRFISFNYKMTWGFLRKPRWLPDIVYDDGKKTYITFPDEVLQTELPAVFEDRTNVVNYRVTNNVMIIDKLVQKISIKLGTYTVVVEKKRGDS